MTVFVSRILPAIRTFISLPAGIARMNIVKFLTYTSIGSFFWSGILTYVGYTLGKKWASIQNILHPISYLVAVIVMAIIIYLIVRVIKRKNVSE